MIVIGIGCNLPFEGCSPIQNMERVVELLGTDPDIRSVTLSPVYVTAPVGRLDQPDFFNAALRLETSLAPLELMRRLLDIEKRFGRVREERWGPRTMDLDLLDFDGQVLDVEEDGVSLTLPHPRLADRGFVLFPLRDLDPKWTHPVSGESIAVLLDRIGPDQTLKRL